MRMAKMLVVPLTMLAACSGKECTAIGCQPGVTLTFASPLVEAGEYTFTITAGDVIDTCRAFVPLRRDGTEPTCSHLFVNRNEITTQSGSGVHGQAGDDIVSVWLGGEYEDVTLLVRRESAQLVAESVTPQYQDVELNGEGCGTCPTARHVVGGS